VLHIGFGFRAFLNPNRSGSASGILRRVRIQYPQLTAAKVSNPKFRGKCGNFLDISKGISQSGMCKFESSEVSQPVRCSEILPSTMLEMPANGGLLQIGGPSPDSKFRYFQGQIADSLRRISEIFPFLGDGGWRPGSICTAWPSLQWNVANSPPWRPAVGNNAKTDHFKPGISSRTRSMAGCARSPPSRGGRSAVATAERSTPRTSETA